MAMMRHHHSDNNLPSIERKVTEQDIFEDPPVAWPAKKTKEWTETDKRIKWQHGFNVDGPVLEGKDAFVGESPYKGMRTSEPMQDMVSEKEEKHLPAYHLPITDEVSAISVPISEQEVFGGPNRWD